MSCHKRFTTVIDNQKGIALISALLLLLVVSLMAVAVSMDTSMDIRIAGYQKFSARSFGSADGGGMAATDVLEDNIHDAGWIADSSDPQYPHITYPSLSKLYNGTLIVKQDHGKFYMDKNVTEDQVLQMTDDIEAEVVVQKGIVVHAEGGAIQMAAGYSGLGKSSGSGGSNAYYNIISTGTGTGKARTELAMHYRHMTK